ncbi:hypothetical protein B0H13DRAFT_1932570 [Mycena leptocephala]|nr:hypothetical protein B0H13DRAFT_1932570 [Mycena leptocephala]
MSPAHQLLLALVFFTSSCGALPVTITHSAAPSVAACFAVLALLLLFVFVKRVYIRKSRRMIQARQNSILTHSVPRHKKKTGFFVGFFGDPTVEIQSALEKGEWTENKQSSFTYRIHTESRPYGPVFVTAQSPPRPAPQIYLLEVPHPSERRAREAALRQRLGHNPDAVKRAPYNAYLNVKSNRSDNRQKSKVSDTEQPTQGVGTS